MHSSSPLAWLKHRPQRTDEHVELPPEVWDLIFHDLPAPTLRIIAGVCRAFNERCSQILLMPVLVTPSSNSPTFKFDLDSTLLPALHRSLFTPPHCIACRFTEHARLPQELKILKSVVERSRTLSHLDLRFDTNLLRFDTNLIDGTENTPARKARLTAFRDIVAIMARRCGGPVIFICNRSLFSCTAADVARFRLDTGFLIHKDELRNRFDPFYHDDTELREVTWDVRTHKGAQISIDALRCICTANIRCVNAMSGPFSSCTIVAVDTGFNFPWLELGSREYVESGLSSAELNALLPYVTLPELTRVVVNTVIDPEVLDGFIARHPSIFSVAFDRYDRFSRDEGEDKINALGIPSLRRLKLIFGTEGAEGYLCVKCQGDSVDAMEGFKHSLRRLSSHPGEVKLDIKLHTSEDLATDQWGLPGGKPLPVFGKHESEIVNRVAAVRLGPLGDAGYRVQGFRTATQMLAWLCLLPQLRMLEVQFKNAVSVNDEDWQIFLADAALALGSRVQVILIPPPGYKGFYSRS